jgi:hypothetical protein
MVDDNLVKYSLIIKYLRERKLNFNNKMNYLVTMYSQRVNILRRLIYYFYKKDLKSYAKKF